MRTTVVAILFMLAAALPASAADITVLCSTGFKAVMDELLPEFERASGNRVTIRYGVSTALAREIDRGAVFDMTILTPAQIDALAAQRLVVPDTRTELARTPIAIAIRRGARRLDIATVDALKRSLLAAESIAYARDGAGGLYFAALAERLGMADALKPKTKFQVNGEQVSRAVARGEAKIGIQPLSEILPHPDLEPLGPFPADVRGYAVMVGGIAAASRQNAAATALIAFLTGPRALPVIAQKGMERR